MKYPVALTIAGSDNSAGAGIQADLKTFSHFKVHGCTVITCVVAENPKVVTGIQAIRSSLVKEQLKTAFDYFPVKAIKTGMLYNLSIIETVGDFLKKNPKPTLIIDPVMVATSGAVLLKPAALKKLKSLIIPRAALVTPNLDEAELLLGRKIKNHQAMKDALKGLYDIYGVPFLLKGGHLKGNQALDIYYNGKQFREYKAPWVKGRIGHGTGCTYSAAITASIARGASMPQAISKAKDFITCSLKHSLKYPQGHQSLNHIDCP